MKYRGREIDAVALWSNYVEFPPNMDTEGPFLTKVKCPNPEHDTLKRHFQINVNEPLVHCFAGCGISGTYENAIMLIEGCSRGEAKKKILRYSSVGVGVGGSTGRGGFGKNEIEFPTQTSCSCSRPFSIFVPSSGRGGISCQ